MEVMFFIIIFVLAFIAAFALWKYVHLKHDVYEYTEKLDNAISHMLKNEELKIKERISMKFFKNIYF